MQDELKKVVTQALKELGVDDRKVTIERPSDPVHGDYTSNVALVVSKQLKRNPREIAEEITQRIKTQDVRRQGIEEIAVAGAGFINFHLTTDFLLSELQKILENDDFVPSQRLKNKKYMVEYGHPNTHKEMHIGHMRTLITGEAIARLLKASGATVFRANYQGDIGPHVAKALWGMQRLMQERQLIIDTGNWKLEFESGNSKIDNLTSNLKPQDQTSNFERQASNIADWSNNDKAHFLGEGYAKGSAEYEENKEEIDGINSKLYQFVISSETRNPMGSLTSVRDDRGVESLYLITRQWSLDYYQDFYERFYTQFDRLFFESAMVASGKKIVEDAIGTVFRKENGAVIFPGEDYGLHTRVFITQAGNPTYEGKEMGNGFAEQHTFPFDMKVHVVASEQAGYFQVVFKALELLDPEKFAAKQHHVSMGMVTLTDRKMSSRTGDVLTVDWLLDQVKEKVNELFSGDRVEEGEKARIAEDVTIAAVKHSVLRVGTGQNVAFSVEKSVSLEGDSGPYLQYTYVRTQSVLQKAGISNVKFQISNIQLENGKLEASELSLLRRLSMFEEVIERAATQYNPSILASYLFDLAQAFNLFYQKVPILNPVILASDASPESKKDGSWASQDDAKAFRLALTDAVGRRMKQGLDLLGIKAPEKM